MENFLDNVKAELRIVSPYITEAGTALITDRIRSSKRRYSIAVQLLTDLNPLSVCQGSCDPQAILGITRSFPRSTILHLPRVHAKIMVADRAVAIVGSANLTDGGIRDNYEYCIKMSSARVCSQIADDVEEYSALGAPITPKLLASYAEVAISLRESFRRKEQAVSSSLKKQFQAGVQSAGDLLLRARVKEGVTGIFSRTILFLLRAGPMRTVDIHPRVQKIHPDLCDDSVDRIIDGERFGKRWKHLVRTAQQILKRDGLIEFDGRLWRLRDTGLT
ncbi:MAG: phospholipase D-like domain-containing protein [Candidatus Methylomirabilis sp.]